MYTYDENTHATLLEQYSSFYYNQRCIDLFSFSVNNINMLAGNLQVWYALPFYKPYIIYSVVIFNLLCT